MFSVLLGTLFLVLWLESRLEAGWVFFLSASVSMPGLPVSLAPNLEDKKTKRTHHWIFSRVPKALRACLPPSTFPSLPLLVLHIRPRVFSLYLAGAIGKTTPSPSSQGGSAELLFSFPLFSLPVESFEDKMRTAFILVSSAPGHDCAQERMSE